MKSESELTVDLCVYLRAQGCLCFAIVGGEMMEPGWPDRWIGYAGNSWWLEFKVGKGQLSSIQFIKLTQLRNVGQSAFVVRHLPGLKLQIEWGGKILATTDYRLLTETLTLLTERGNGTQ